MRLIGLDVGDRRIGVAKVDTRVKIAIPYGTVLVDGAELEEIAKIARLYDADLFVIGLPRNSSGVETAQSAKARAFGDRLQNHLRSARIHFQDESLTSVEAENRLKSRGKPYQKSDIDAEAATIILQDLIEEFTRRGGDSAVEQFFSRKPALPRASTFGGSPIPRSLSAANSSASDPLAGSSAPALPKVSLPPPARYRTPSTFSSKPSPRSVSSLSTRFRDSSEPDDAIFADLDLGSDESSSKTLTPAAISAKITAITARIPSPKQLIVNITEYQIPRRLIDSIRRLPTALSDKNSAKNFHHASTSPSLNPVESDPDPELSSESAFSSDLSNEATKPPRFKLFGRIAPRKTSKSANRPLSSNCITDDNKSQEGETANSRPKTVVSGLISRFSRLQLIAGSLVILGLAVLGGAYSWYKVNLGSVSGANTCKNAQSVACTSVSFKVESGATANTVVSSLYNQKLIRSPLAFNIYLKLNRQSSALKAGVHRLNSAMTVPEIVSALSTASSKDVFSFMIKPGETIFDIKKNLMAKGYGMIEIDAAFNKKYSHDVLKTKPEDASLEGYLFGETYEFFSDETVENIIIRALDQTAKFVREQQLEDGYRQRGLTLHQGLTLASIIQKETVMDHAVIAQIFEKRFRSGEMLGSDVTVSYAVNLVDPKREIYRTNADRLNIDSPYNTRKYPGLPPTPISAPGAASLRAVAHPADTDYLFFLTGDDQKMYYGKTSAEHEYNRTQFCRRLCAVPL